MERTSIVGDYSHFSSLAFLLVHDPIAAEVIAVDTVLTSVRRPLVPDGPPGIQRAKRKLARQATGHIRKRRLLGLLPWTGGRPDGVELTEPTRRVWDALASLTPRQQVAVVMARFEGATLTEIADALDCSSAAANAHLERAARALSGSLGADVDLRSLLTGELGSIARAFLRDHRPDAGAAEIALRRSGRWRAWGIAVGALGAGIAAAVFNLLRG